MLLYYWIYLTRCEKKIKCSASLAFYLFSWTCFINSIKHKHSCKILYISHMWKYKKKLYFIVMCNIRYSFFTGMLGYICFIVNFSEPTLFQVQATTLHCISGQNNMSRNEINVIFITNNWIYIYSIHFWNNMSYSWQTIEFTFYNMQFWNNMFCFKTVCYKK